MSQDKSRSASLWLLWTTLALNDFVDRWKIDGDVISCRHCSSRQHVAWKNFNFPHRVDCPNLYHEPNPWKNLAVLINSQIMKGLGVQKVSDPTKTTITVPLWALNFILENGSFQDEGPFPEGWASGEMKRALDAIGAALKEVTHAD